MSQRFYRSISLVLLVLLAASAAANDFSITPNAVGLDSTKYRWSISTDNGPAQDNPPLTVLTGQTYTFTVSTTTIHPFWIDQSPGFGGVDPFPYGVGADLSDNDVTGSKTLTLTLPADAPDTLYYACGFHSSMTGTITVVHDLVFRNKFE